jgi:hypothetical protein
MTTAQAFPLDTVPPTPVPSTRDRSPSDEERERRQEFVRFALHDAEPWHREHLGRLYADWAEYNATYFGGLLVPPYILLAEPSSPRRYGDFGTVSAWGARSQIRLRPSLLTGKHPDINAAAPDEGRYRFVTDILLHEMLHQFAQEVTGLQDKSYHGHGPAFRDECNRIGAMLGLPPVRICKKRGKAKDLPSCSQWPHNVRPGDWYMGAYTPPRDIEDDAPSDEILIVPANPLQMASLLRALLTPADLDALRGALAVPGTGDTREGGTA